MISPSAAGKTMKAMAGCVLLLNSVTTIPMMQMRPRMPTSMSLIH